MQSSFKKQFGLCSAKLAGAAFMLLSVLPVARGEETVALTGNHPDAVSQIASQGNAPGYQPLKMQIYLAPRNQAQLDELSEEQQDPSSPQYHHWLTPAEFNQRFGPSDADVAQITQWLKGQGFTVTFSSAQQRRIAFTGDVTTAQAAFQVQIAQSSDGKRFGNIEDPRVPASFAPKIAYLAGLDNLHANVWNTDIADPPYNNNGFNSPLFGPPDIETFSDETPLLTAMPPLNGTGECIAVSEGSDVDLASLNYFNTIFSLSQLTQGSNFVSVFPPDPSFPAGAAPPAEPPGSDGAGQPYSEAILDVEYAHGLAPGAEIVFYASDAGTGAADPAGDLVDTISAIVNDANHHCLSVAVSWAQCGEPSSFFTNLSSLFQQGASEGQTFFVATGDFGTAAPSPGNCDVPPVPRHQNIEENAASPYVTAVGASMFQATYDGAGNDTSTDADTTQYVWDYILTSNFSFFRGQGASTGGYSKVFLRPTWQNKVAGISGKFRAVPDLVLGGGNLGGKENIEVPKKGSIKITGSLYDAPGFWECLDLGYDEGEGTSEGPSCTLVGGTSIVPPQYAAIFSIVNQKTASAGQGLINPTLYAMAQANLKNLKSVGIIDILSKNNAYPPEPGYSAHKGFDLASGWGAIDINQFVTSFIAFSTPAAQPQQ